MMTEQAKAGWASVLPFYYGWAVLAASAITELLITGATAYSAGLFVLPLQAEFGLSRASASSPLILLYLGAAVFGPIAGRILDRFPIRPVMCLGAISFCASLLIIATSTSLRIMALAVLLPGALGYLVLGMLNTSTLASRWFFRRRGLALGIGAVATSGGGFVTPLLAWAIHLYGWRTALVYESAAIALIVLLLASLLVRDSPAAMALAGHRENAGREEANIRHQPARDPGTGVAGELHRWRTILRNRGFWAPSLLVATISGISGAIVTAAVPMGVQLGFAAQAAFLASAFAISAAITKILSGIVSDIMDKRILLLCAMTCMMASLALLCVFPTFSALAAACGLAGIALGGSLPTSAALIAMRFGSTRFGGAMGWTFLLIGAFTMAAIWISGTVYDRTGAYHFGFVIFLAFCALMSVTALILESGVPRTGQEEPQRAAQG